MRLEHEDYGNVNGKANAGLTLGIIGTALSALGGNLGNIFGGTGTVPVCHEDHFVNRYEAGQASRIAELETRNKLLESNIYTDTKIADVYERLNAKIGGVEAQLAQQAVYNATNTATIGCISNQVAQLMALTKVVIPASSICPPVMPLYNSWTAPTTTPTTTG